MIINNWGLFFWDDDDEERNRLFLYSSFLYSSARRSGGRWTEHCDEVVVFVVVDFGTGLLVWVSD